MYFAPQHRRYLVDQEKALTAELAELEHSLMRFTKRQARRRMDVRASLEKVRGDLGRWTQENFARLPPREQNLHHKAFVTNGARPDYRELATLSYQDGGQNRQMIVPKGDMLHQFREDVRTNNLPTVSWLIPSERFSDHPSNPWYGALYISETLDILTQNPEVWKKTIFILCYDENDGYFDHVPPFVPPRADRSDTGKVSAGIDTSSEHVKEDPAKDPRDDGPGQQGRDGPIGLGFRVPLVVASPWSRGGYVCSEVFDHTSVLRLLENLLTPKAGEPIRETNISDWRRTVCGDMSSVFRSCDETRPPGPSPLVQDQFLAGINQAQYRPPPGDFRQVTKGEVETGGGRPFLPRQENGTRPSCPLPYELSVNGSLSDDRSSFEIRFGAGNQLFGARSAGSPFHVYSPAGFRTVRDRSGAFETGRTWAYAVAAGGQVADQWPTVDFEGGAYLLRVHGPNGFFREFQGNADDPMLDVVLKDGTQTAQPSWVAELTLANRDRAQAVTVTVEDPSYGSIRRTLSLGPAGEADCGMTFPIPLQRSLGWYDLVIRVHRSPGFGQRFCGRVECGAPGISDPLMAGPA